MYIKSERESKLSPPNYCEPKILLSHFLSVIENSFRKEVKGKR